MVEFKRWFGMPNIYTFRVKGVKEFINENIKGDVLVPFGGMEHLDRNNNKIMTCDIKHPNKEEAAAADFWCDATDLDKSPEIKDKKFDTILLDPPFTFFQAVHSYKLKGNKIFKMTDVVKAKNEAFRKCKKDCRVITLGFNTVGMSNERGFGLKKVGIITHGGNHNDTLITVEDRIKRPKERFIKKMEEMYGEKY